MNFRIDRKPSFPTSTNFLEQGIIECPIFCIGAYEVYKIQSDSDALFGLVIRCETKAEALEQGELQQAWWQLQGEDRIKLLTCEIVPHGHWHLVLAFVKIPRIIITFDKLESSPFTENEILSLFSDLIETCKVGYSKAINPIIEIGAILLVRHNKTINSIPLFVKRATLPKENEAIKTITEVIYFLASGIDPATFKKVALIPPINRWNKDISKQISSFVGLCLDKDNPRGISSLDALEVELHNLSERDSIPQAGRLVNQQKTVCSDRSQKLGGLIKVAGMSELKALLIEEIIRPIQDPEPFKRYGIPIPNGILLYGPPGCGKTYIARQLAEELGWYFKEIKGSDVGSMYVHGSVLAIRELFAEAEEYAPAMIFIDEFEGLVPKRSELSGFQQHKSEEVNEFLVNLNECSANKIFVLAATNEPDKIDAAARRPGRLDKLIYVGPPDLEARRELLKLYLQHRPTVDVDIEKYAKQLAGYSCKDINYITDESARMALKEDKPIDNNHIDEAIRRNPSSLSDDILSKYKTFQQRGM